MLHILSNLIYCIVLVKKYKMALHLKICRLGNSLICYQSSVKLKNEICLHSSLKYSTSAAEIIPSAPSTDIQMAKSIQELPGMDTTTLIKEYFLGKFARNRKKLPVFDRKQNFKFWSSMKDIYGPTFKMDFFGRKMIVLTNPDDIQKLYSITMREPVRGGFYVFKKIRYEAEDNFFNKKAGIFAENFDEWHRVRSKIQTPMMRPKNIAKYLKSMDDISKDFTDVIAELQQKHGDMPRDFQNEIYKFALETVGVVGLNRRLGCLESNLPPDSEQVRLINSINNMFELLSITQVEFPMWKFFYSPSFNKLKKEHDFMTSVIYSYVVEAEKKLAKKIMVDGLPEELTLLEIFLQTEGLTRKDVVTFMLDMFFAGIDTTSHTLGFTLYLLARNKEKQKKLQEEIDSVLGNGEGTLSEHQLAKLSYLKACVKESLRLYSIVPGNVRILQEDAVLGGYKIPKGHAMFAFNLFTARDEKNFQNSTEFIPERWSRDRPLGQIHPYASIPFSHGTRMCVGRRIAEQEMYTFLARVLHRFSVDYKYQDMDIISRLVSIPSEPLRFEFTDRKRKFN